MSNGGGVTDETVDCGDGPVVAALAITGTASAATNGMIAFGGEETQEAMNADGTGARPLFTVDQYFRPAWSPDGNSLAVLYWPDADPRPNVALARLDKDDGVRIVARDGALPSFSPDSKRIAYAR
jgi:Tol biopolymer transport system component